METTKLDTFTQAYMECAVWASTDFLDLNGEDIAPETAAAMAADCEAFQRDNAELLELWYAAGETADRAGHDFWLTREGHGAGFWDRFCGGSPMVRTGRLLTDASKAYGSFDLYLSDDKQIHHA